MEIATSYLPMILLGLKVAGVATFMLFVVKPIYDYYRDPHDLRRFPTASRWAAFTNLWYMYIGWSHQRYIRLHAAHKKHPIVRVGPNHLSCGRADAIREVLGHGVFLRKTDFYAVLAGSHRHIVDEQDRGEHSRKRKLLAAAYSAKAVASYEPVIARKVSTVIRKFDESCSLPPRKGQVVLGSETINFRLWSNILTFEVIAKIGASQDIGMLDQGSDLTEVETLEGKVYKTNVIKSLHESTKISVTFAWSEYWYKFNRWLTQLHPGWWHGRAWGDFIVRIARERVKMDNEGQRHDDFLGHLLYDRDQKPRDPEFGHVLAETNSKQTHFCDQTLLTHP